MTRWIAGAVCTVGLLAGATMVSASVPNPDGTISACVNDATGVVRIVDPAKSVGLGRCIAGGYLRETPVMWSVTGPPGPAGPPGNPGPAGPAGPAASSNVTLGPTVGASLTGQQLAIIESACPAGSIAVGRNYTTGTGTGDDVKIMLDRQSSTSPGWFMQVRSDDPFAFYFVWLEAICLS